MSNDISTMYTKYGDYILQRRKRGNLSITYQMKNQCKTKRRSLGVER